MAALFSHFHPWVSSLLLMCSLLIGSNYSPHTTFPFTFSTSLIFLVNGKSLLFGGLLCFHMENYLRDILGNFFKCPSVDS